MTKVRCGVGRVVVDVEGGREVHLHAERASLDRGDPSLLVREHRVARRAERHLRREDRGPAQIDRVGQEVPTPRALTGPVLEITADEQRHRRHPLQRIQFGRDLLR